MSVDSVVLRTLLVRTLIPLGSAKCHTRKGLLTMSIPPNQLFQVLSPARENSTYRYRIRQAGLDFNAYLTYEIPQVSDERTILLVNVSYAFISDEHKFEYNRFIERIRESAGRFTGMKNIVNRLADKEFSKLPNVRVAVHKYGPVPVYVLPEKYSIANLGKILQVQIGVYPDIKSQFGSRKSINLKLPFLSTGSEFIRSLNLGLGLMFRRYLEDVGEGMFDIEYHLNLAGVFDRAKEIEAILAESVKSKLDVAFPSVSSFQYPSNEQDTLVNELFEKEKDWLLTARYARQYALYFLNELYGHIGMESRSQSYLDSFKDIQRQFDSLFELGYYQNARTRLSAVATLSKALRAYLDEDYEKIGEIDLASEPLWTRRFVQFGKFIASLNKEKIAATAGRIFISYHHDVPVTEVLKSQIQDYIKSQFGDRVHVLSVRESSAGIHFKSPIRSRIWLSDTIKGIVPKNTQTISGDNDKDYLWIAREVEYGLLLGKRIVYLVEKDIDDDRVLRDLRRARISLIPTDARVPEWLNQELVESFTECTRASFIVDNVGGTQEHLDPKVRPIIYE